MKHSLTYYWLKLQAWWVGRKLDAAIERRTKLRDELAPKIGGITAIPTMLDWWAKAKHEGCPTCGLDFSKTPPEYNVAPHYAGACVAGLSAESKGEECECGK